MRLKDYLVGIPVTLASPLSPEDVARRINASTGSMFWPFHYQKVIGGAWLGFVRLGFQSWPFDYNAKPILAGRMADHLGGTEIRARYGAPAWMKVFLLFWYGFVGIFFLAIALDPAGIEPGAGPFILVVFPLFALIPLIMHYALTRGSDADLERIVAFLEDVTEARAH